MAEPTKLEVWNAKTSCSQTKNEEDEGEAGVEMLKTKESPDGASPPIQRELNELREHPKGTSETATGRGRLFTKSHWLNKYPLRDILTHKDKILGEECKDTAALEEQLNLIAVEQEKLRKDRIAHIYEDLCISEEKGAMTRDGSDLKLKVEEIGGQSKGSASLEEQLNQVTMECNELIKDREALIYEATHISEEKETLTEDRDALNLEVERLREQCKKAAALEEQLNQMQVECNELRKDREALIYEAISISEEKEYIKLEKDVLNLEIENFRILVGRKF